MSATKLTRLLKALAEAFLPGCEILIQRHLIRLAPGLALVERRLRRRLRHAHYTDLTRREILRHHKRAIAELERLRCPRRRVIDNRAFRVIVRTAMVRAIALWDGGSPLFQEVFFIRHNASSKA